jgi:hypothetical protein
MASGLREVGTGMYDLVGGGKRILWMDIAVGEKG